jgi:hypothetical protein
MRERERPLTDSEYSQLALIIAGRFVARWDMYARQLSDGRYQAVHQLLDGGQLVEHLKGRLTLGSYLLNRHGQGRCLVLDADDEEHWARLKAMGERLLEEGVPSYLEESRRGGHQWLFLPITVSGERLRRFARGLLVAHEVGEVEVFPKQDRLTTGPGSLIRLPFGIHQKSGKRYGFYHPDGRPLAPTLHQQIERLRAARTVPLGAFESYSRLADEAPEMAAVATPGRPSRPVATIDASAPLSERLKAAITVRDFIERFAPEVELNEQGLGYCPFHEDNVRSFGVDEARNFWHCFAGCGGGSLIDFWMRWRGRAGLDDSFRATIKDLAQMLL